MFSLPKTKIEVVVGKAGKREEFISLLVELCTANTNPHFPLMEKLHFQSSSRAWVPTRKEKLDPLNKGIQRTLRKPRFHDWKELFEGAGFIRDMYYTQLLHPGCFHDADYANEGMEHRWCQIRGKKKINNAISANWLHRSHEVFNYLQTELIASSNTYSSPFQNPQQDKRPKPPVLGYLWARHCRISSAGRQKKNLRKALKMSKSSCTL